MVMIISFAQRYVIYQAILSIYSKLVKKSSEYLSIVIPLSKKKYFDENTNKYLEKHGQNGEMNLLQILIIFYFIGMKKKLLSSKNIYSVDK